MAKINEIQMPIFLKLGEEERRTGVCNLVAGKGGNYGETGKKVDWRCKCACACVLGNT